jgi:hypothetical protein
MQGREGRPVTGSPIDIRESLDLHNRIAVVCCCGILDLGQTELGEVCELRRPIGKKVRKALEINH